jgi:RNA polymerase sigma-70 factor (ECF subfamily)
MSTHADNFDSESVLESIRTWIAAGRNGSTAARGKLFEHFRNYLLLMAQHKLGNGLQSKVGASDLVQQTFLDAERGFATFHGDTDGELLAWLQRILANNACQAARHYYGTAKRDPRVEQSLAEAGQDAREIQIESNIETPSRQLAATEESDALAAALARLPWHYRKVIELRNHEYKSFEEISALMNCSSAASRNLWIRAVEKLRVELDSKHELPPSA